MSKLNKIALTVVSTIAAFALVFVLAFVMAPKLSVLAIFAGFPIGWALRLFHRYVWSR